MCVHEFVVVCVCMWFVCSEDMDDQIQQDGGGEDDEEAMEQVSSGPSATLNQIRTHPPATVIVSVSCESLRVWLWVVENSMFIHMCTLETFV